MKTTVLLLTKCQLLTGRLRGVEWLNLVLGKQRENFKLLKLKIMR